MTTTANAGLAGAEDSAHVDYANSQQRVICTCDSDFLRLHDENVSHPGIAYFHQQSRSIGEVISALELIWEALELIWEALELIWEALELIWEALEPEEMRNRVEFL